MINAASAISTTTATTPGTVSKTVVVIGIAALVAFILLK